MIGFNGGLIGGFRDTAGLASVPGVWTANEQVVAQRRGRWFADPFFSSVSLLLPGDGTNGSTSIIDRSPSPKTVTAFGNAQISTAQSRFGGSSLAFDGSGDALRVSGNAAFGLGVGNFTIEFWLYYLGGNGYVFFLITNGGSGNYIGYGLNVGSKNPFVWNEANVLTTGSPITNGIWQHHAITRENGTLQIFLDGIAIGSTPWNVDLGTSRPLSIGDNASGQQVTNGFIDDLRITKGVARYTANFTPPAAPHPLF